MCGIGVTSLIIWTFIPAACRARRAASLPAPGPFIFLLSASSSSQVTFIVVLGLLSLLKGLVFLFGPREKVKGMIDWWLQASDKTHKTWAVGVMGLGIAILATLLR